MISECIKMMFLVSFVKIDGNLDCAKYIKLQNNFIPILEVGVWFGLVSPFNGISTPVCYLIPKLFSEKNSCGTI